MLQLIFTYADFRRDGMTSLPQYVTTFDKDLAYSDQAIYIVPAAQPKLIPWPALETK